MANAMDSKNISNIDTVLKNFEVLQVALDELRSDREHASMALGLAAILDNFSMFLACICPAKYFLCLSSSLEHCKQRASQCRTR